MVKYLITTVTCFILGILSIKLSEYILQFFNTASFDSIIYHLLSPFRGTDTTPIYDFLNSNYMPCFIVLAVAVPVFVLMSMLKAPKLVYRLIGAASLLFFVGALAYSLNEVRFFDYIRNKGLQSEFIKNNYHDSRKTVIKEPARKKNLLVIYVESLEASFASEEKGGLFKDNYIPFLTKLAQEHVCFSHSEQIGGAMAVTGTGWTTAGLVTTMAGVNIQTPFKTELINDKNPFTYAHLATLPDLLDKYGYKEYFLMGADSEFGGIKEFLNSHGSFTIYDLPALVQEAGQKGETVEASGWGLDDKTIFDRAKADLERLGREDAPFYYNIMTIDTHAPTGKTTSDCKCSYEDSYTNAIACLDFHIEQFYNWLSQQPFFENTVLVIMGDHLTMNHAFFEGTTKARSIYNVFVNTKPAANMKNRAFCQMDLYPTILSGLGFEIENHRLALGTDLFSEEKTLCEEHGLGKVDEEFSKYSKFYDQHILNGE
ncbi:MAG: LTA synthase family protein [Bacteroidales bacterium]|nr:LTA synthase family protein [Candidatus Physcocola equi]